MNIDINDTIIRINTLLGRSLDLSTFISTVEKECKEVMPWLATHTGDQIYAQALLLKISNLLIGKYQFLKRHKQLIARPYGLIVDPSNNCPLKCPGCIHSEKLKKNSLVDWPHALLSDELFYRFIEQYGPYALFIHFYNWGEPLLNKSTPKFIKRAKEYMLYTALSSNLSVRFDAEAIVRSGLDYLIMSIDGATAETYSHYRRNGNFELVLSNVKALVEAKKKYNSSTPWLAWQFLTFEHNSVEIPMAKELADGMGVDSLLLSKPYDVSWADPTIVGMESAQERMVFERGNVFKENVGKKKITDSISPNFEKYFKEKWVGPFFNEEDYADASKMENTCHWLHKNMVMDACGRILPCCFAPQKNSDLMYVFSKYDTKKSEDHFNSKYYQMARSLSPSGSKQSLIFEDMVKPYCSNCSLGNKERPNISSDSIRQYFSNYYLGGFPGPPFLNAESITILGEW